jgi:hypothetical protein
MEDGETVPQGVSDELFDSMLAFTPHRADELRALLRKRRVEVRAVATQHESPLVAIPGEV